MTNPDMRAYENMLAKLVAECSKEELADCALLLAMNLANYKSRFGELPSENFKEMLTTDTIDEGTARILMEGSEEMIKTLAMVAGETDADMNEEDGDEYDSLH